MVTLSTCLIVKNESENIRRCLDGLISFSDEIIIYDTGSNDGTQDICREYEKVNLIQGTWKNDFGWARNQSFSYATKDYILWVDADDIVDEKTQKWFKDMKEKDFDGYDMVTLGYFYDAVSEDDTSGFSFPRERIMRRANNPRWYDRIHEYVILEHCNGRYDIPFDEAHIIHLKHETDPMRNYNIFREMIDNRERITGRNYYYFGKECWSLEKYDEAKDAFKKAIGNNDIWEIDRLNSCINISRIYLEQDHDLYEALKYASRALPCTSVPRADVCCMIGIIYNEMGEYEWGRFWLEKAYLNWPKDDFEGNFLSESYVTWIPLVNLCVSEDHLGNREKAEEYNNMAFEYNNENEAILSNKKYFEELRKNGEL